MLEYWDHQCLNVGWKMNLEVKGSGDHSLDVHFLEILDEVGHVVFVL